MSILDEYIEKHLEKYRQEQKVRLNNEASRFNKLQESAEKSGISIDESLIETGFQVSNTDDERVSLIEPCDGTILIADKLNFIAHYREELGIWSLEKGISPDVLPQIGGKPTITHEQYNAMYRVAQKVWAEKFVGPGGLNYKCMTPVIRTPEQELANAVRNFNEMKPSTREVLLAIAHKPTTAEIIEYARTEGSNSQYYKGTSKFVVSLPDVVHCMFANTGRIKEVEPEYETSDDLDEFINSFENESNQTENTEILSKDDPIDR